MVDGKRRWERECEPGLGGRRPNPNNNRTSPSLEAASSPPPLEPRVLMRSMSPARWKGGGRGGGWRIDSSLGHYFYNPCLPIDHSSHLLFLAPPPRPPPPRPARARPTRCRRRVRAHAGAGARKRGGRFAPRSSLTPTPPPLQRHRLQQQHGPLHTAAAGCSMAHLGVRISGGRAWGAGYRGGERRKK